VIESLGNGALSSHIPTHQPVVVAWLKVEEIRLLLGVAIGQASTNHPGWPADGEPHPSP
jgi:hypothetical protein